MHGAGSPCDRGAPIICDIGPGCKSPLLDPTAVRPVLPGRDPGGRPLKREFGPWVLPVFRLLARMKGLRGKAYDPFGWLPERRTERAAIAAYEADLREVLPLVTPATLGLIRELAELPLSVRGYGTVKEASAHEAATRRTALLEAIRQGGSPMAQAAE